MSAAVKLLLTLLLLAPWVQSKAQEVRPALLEFREVLPGLYDFLWKTPSHGDSVLDIEPVMPVACRLNGAIEQQQMPEALLRRGRLQCTDGLAGKTVSIRGLDATAIDVVVRVHHRDGRLEQHLIRPVSSQLTLNGMTSLAQRLLTYAGLGFERLLLGAEQLLFVLGLMLIASGRGARTMTIAAFTLAYGAVLALQVLNIISLPLPPLNVTIALGLMALGPEMLRRLRGEESFALHHPWVVALVFGFPHGAALAGGLNGAALPVDEVVPALAMFIIGVEFGLLSFVLLLVLLGRLFRVLQIHWPRYIAILPGYLVGSLGAYWTLQRLLVLLGMLK
ncbi:MAG: HupE/UreJ family protein [Oceanospirillaceae bacterium]|nr:HupE/UreJ family protein [Oceanospirillaceae bacterium]